MADTKTEKEVEVKGLDEEIKEEQEEEQVTLVSKDKKTILVPRKYIKISGLLRITIEEDKEAQVIPVPGVDSAMLERIITFFGLCKGVDLPIIPKPLRSKDMRTVTEAWAAEYILKIAENRQALYDLIIAANYLDMPGLLHLGCATVASLIKGQPLDKIKEILLQGMEKKETEQKKNSIPSEK